MARTPLLRVLKRLAREHDAAEHLGITPADLRQRRNTDFSRREFIKSAAAIGVLASIKGIKPALALSKPRIAIVGAGISGLAAALKLQDNGIDAIVYEAAHRVGGRMHSDHSGYWAEGQVSEFCGELIDSGHATILRLATRFGLAVDDLLAAQPIGSSDTYWFLNRRYTAAQADADFVPVREAAKKDAADAGYPTSWNSYTTAGYALDHTSVYDWIRTRVPGGHQSSFGRLLDVAYTIEYGAETKDQSSLNILYLLSDQPSPDGFAIFGSSDEQYHIMGGNERLAQAIAHVIPDIRRDWRLTSLETRPDHAVGLGFQTPRGTEHLTVDHVILAFPFAVLRKLDISRAGFDTMKLQAINELGTGRNIKLQLQFNSRYWNRTGAWGSSNGNSFSDLGYQNTWDVSRAQYGTPGIIVNYIGGDTAEEFKPKSPYSRADADPTVTTHAQAFLRQFETLFPGISAEWNGRATLSAPILDPNLLCSYSYWKVGQYTAFGGYERVPQAAIHFAGEHCSQSFQGFMEGGASEGERAADEVVKAIGR